MAGIVGFDGPTPGPGATKTLTREVHSVTFQVGALVQSFADVTALGLVWAKAGDVYTWNPTSRLDDVGLIDINCATSGTLTARFFGTTGGGDYVVSVCHTSAP